MEITLFENDTLFSALFDEWRELLADSTADTIFLTCEWQSAWWQAYQPGQIWALVVREKTGGRLLGIAPWFIQLEADGSHIMRAIGCVDVVDYLEIIARRGHEEAVHQALVDYLAEHPGPYDEIRLCNIPQASPTFSLLPALLEKRGFAVRTNIQEVCPVIKLPPTWDEYLAALDKKQRHELRRKLRRASGSADEIDWYIVGPGHHLEEELECFLQLMAASSKDKAEFLKDPQNAAFFRMVVPIVAEKGWLQLSFLTVRGQAVAAYLSFDYGNRVMIYNSGLQPDSHGQLSPGIVLLARLIDHAITQKRDVFDFLRGSEPYKYDMGGKDTYVYQLVVSARPQA